MKITGYMIEVEWDGSSLLARPTSRMSRVALLGQDHKVGEVVIPREEMERVDFKAASRVGNGNLTIHTQGGKSYQLHYRRKSQEDFDRLREALGV